MFNKTDILTQIAEVNELEQRINAGDIGHLRMGDDKDDVVAQAEAILKEINEGLDKQTGLTRAQLIVMSDAVAAQANAANGTDLSREDLLAKTGSIIADVNKTLDDESREAECLTRPRCCMPTPAWLKKLVNALQVRGTGCPGFLREGQRDVL